MRFDARIPIASAAAAAALCADPAASPGSVPDAFVFELGFALRAYQAPLRRVLLALDGAATETLTVEIWAIDDATWPNQGADSPGGLTMRRFYLVGASAVTVTAKQLAEITDEVPAPGRVYARVTGGTLATAGTLLIAGAS